VIGIVIQTKSEEHSTATNKETRLSWVVVAWGSVSVCVMKRARESDLPFTFTEV
jgi:hypothetical protein